MQEFQSSRELPEAFSKVEIIGMGLAGTLLGLRLEKLGIPFQIFDKPLNGFASIVAPGIVNPLAGRKLKPPQRLTELLEVSKTTFQSIENDLGITFWHELPIQRMFFSESQLKYFEKSQANPAATPYIGEILEPNSLGKKFYDEMGSFMTKQGAWVNLAELLSAARKRFSEMGVLIEDVMDPNPPESKDTARIWCEGWRSSINPLWDWIPFNPAKGEMLIVEFKEPIEPDRIYNKSCWMQPFGDQDHWRVGATYSWAEMDSTPTMEGFRSLSDRIKDLTSIPFTIVDQIAGVRPIVEDYKPIIGQHPEHKNCFILNAFGSKGVLQGPLVVNAFLDQLLNEQESAPEFSIGRFL